MGSAIGQILGSAVGVAISPVPIIALILMLFSAAAARNSLSFLAGWVIGLGAVAAVVLAIGVSASDDGGSTAGGVLKIIVGVAFLLLAVKQWRSRPGPGEEPALPSWMSAIDDLSALKAFGLGLLLTVPNPKNLGLTIAAAATISQAGLPTGQNVVVVIVFVVIASITILLPVLAFLLARKRAEPVLQELKVWLSSNTATVMTVLFTVLGAKVLGDGISLVA